MAATKPSGNSADNASSLNLRPPLVGHSEQLAELLESASSGRMHHGWLLHGPKGVGKARFAAELAARFLAQSPGAREAQQALDLTDTGVRLVEQGAHPDLVWLDRVATAGGKKLPKYIPAANVRSGVQKLHATAGYGGWRILVVDAVDDLNVEGANALLKPLEEPLKQTLLLLVAHSISAVLPTIRSRCRKLALSLVDDADLERLAGDGQDDDHAPLAINLAHGRPGRLQMLLSSSDILASFSAFCAQAATFGGSKASTGANDKRTLVEHIMRLGLDEKATFFELLDDWMSRRLHHREEPAGLANPALDLSLAGQHALAELWAKQGAGRHIRQALNIDLAEQLMALLHGLEEVYSQGARHPN